MPLSSCPRCGFVCRVLWPASASMDCPECDSKMRRIGRDALPKDKLPESILRTRYAEWRKPLNRA